MKKKERYTSNSTHNQENNFVREINTFTFYVQAKFEQFLARGWRSACVPGEMLPRDGRSGCAATPRVPLNKFVLACHARKQVWVQLVAQHDKGRQNNKIRKYPESKDKLEALRRFCLYSYEYFRRNGQTCCRKTV